MKIGEVAIHCPTVELANQVLSIADNLGFTWCNGLSFKNRNNWDYYKERTCYNIEGGVYCGLEFYMQENKLTIIQAEQFIKEYSYLLSDTNKEEEYSFYDSPFINLKTKKHG